MKINKVYSNIKDFLKNPYSYVIKNSSCYNKLMTKKVVLENEVDGLREEINLFVNDYFDLSEQAGFLRERLGKYQEGVENTPEYIRAIEKVDKLEAIIEEYKNEVRKRGRLIDHLKKNKSNFKKFLNTVIDKIPKTIMDFFKNDKEYKKPIIFVNSHGFIIGHTSAAKNVLGVNYELVGKSGYKLLEEIYPDLKGSNRLRRFFNTREEREFSVIVNTPGRRKIKLNLTKGEPGVIKDLDLRIIGRNRTIETIAFVPISINTPNILTNLFASRPDIVKAIRKYETNMKKVYSSLITDYNWTAEQIKEVESSHGPEGLRKIYADLKKEKKLKKKKSK